MTQMIWLTSFFFAICCKKFLLNYMIYARSKFSLEWYKQIYSHKTFKVAKAVDWPSKLVARHMIWPRSSHVMLDINNRLVMKPFSLSTTSTTEMFWMWVSHFIFGIGLPKNTTSNITSSVMFAVMFDVTLINFGSFSPSPLFPRGPGGPWKMVEYQT